MPDAESKSLYETVRMPVPIKFDVAHAVAILAPHLTDISTRKAVVDKAFGHDHILSHVLDFSGSAEIFTEHLIKRLLAYGNEAVWTLLVTLLELVIAEKQAETGKMEPLIDHRVSTAEPPSKPILRKASVTRVSTTATLILPSVTPQTARVFVDNVEYATGEIEWEMRADTCVVEVRVECDGYFPERFQAKLIRGERTEFKPITMRKKRVVVVETLVAPTVIVPKQSEPTRINPKDNAEIIHIPAGDFLMGDTDRKDNPRRSVTLSGYYIYKYPVTVKQYRIFCEKSKGKHKMPKPPSWGRIDDHPMVYVSWKEAEAYCESVGGSLPSEAQWEKAARGKDGRQYPWGDEWDATKCANFKNSPNGTKPVGSYPLGASPYGVLDMAGDVWEWCLDVYESDWYKVAPTVNPVNAQSNNSSTLRLLRGGSWNSNNAERFRTAYRIIYIPSDKYDGFGFRCCLPEP